MAPADTTVAFAAREYGGICRVHGYVTTRDPGPNQVLFVLVLPDNFNGRYLYQGVGGAAGSLPAVSANLLRMGYAIGASDGGSGAKNAADFSFNSDPAKRMDFAWRGVHVSATATQHITKAYYGLDTIQRYATGCSGGGHMGMENALRFGRQDFDGFIVGATPFPDTVYLPNAYRIAQYLQTHPDGWIPPDLMKQADDAILLQYDESDGARDGIIADARNIDFNVESLRDVGFTQAQIETFNSIHLPQQIAGTVGDRIQPGYPVSNVASWSGFLLGMQPPPWPSVATTPPAEISALGAPYIHVMADTMVRAQHPDVYYVDISDPAELTRIALLESETSTKDWDTFAASGGKMIFYHGVNDQANSYLETLDSYDKVAAEHDDNANWLRYFPVAGLMHCAGGPGPTGVEDSLLEAMVAWVELGQAPDTIVALRRTPERGVERSFRLCAEPARVGLKEAGLDPTQAENWVCHAPGEEGY